MEFHTSPTFPGIQGAIVEYLGMSGGPTVGIQEHKKGVGCTTGGRWDLGNPDQAGYRDRRQQRFLDPPEKTWSLLMVRLVTGGSGVVRTHYLFMKQGEGQVSSWK